MTRFFSMTAVALVAAAAASTASAGCSPACKSGEVCRYEAAGGKFYCEAKSFKSGQSLMRPGQQTGVATPTHRLRTLGN